MIKLKRTVKDTYNYDVDFYVRKESIIGVYEVKRRAQIMLVSGETIEVHETADVVLKLLE